MKGIRGRLFGFCVLICEEDTKDVRTAVVLRVTLSRTGNTRGLPQQLGLDYRCSVTRPQELRSHRLERVLR